jgi:hypothetical protein
MISSENFLDLRSEYRFENWAAIYHDKTEKINSIEMKGFPGYINSGKGK